MGLLGVELGLELPVPDGLGAPGAVPEGLPEGTGALPDGAGLVPTGLTGVDLDGAVPEGLGAELEPVVGGLGAELVAAEVTGLLLLTALVTGAEVTGLLVVTGVLVALVTGVLLLTDEVTGALEVAGDEVADQTGVEVDQESDHESDQELPQAPVGRVQAAVLLAGQLVTSGPQLVTVSTVVTSTVWVCCQAGTARTPAMRAALVNAYFIFAVVWLFFGT